MNDPAPLIGTQAAPVPPGAIAEWVRATDGVRLRAALFPATGAPRGGVLLEPGRSEPIEKYFEVVERLRTRGFSVLAHDWRGQGLSHRALPDRLRGHASGFDEYLADRAALLTAYEGRLPKPWIGLSHSMGGCLALLALMNGETRLSGQILTAPMLGMQVGAPQALARALARLFRLVGLGDRLAPGRDHDPIKAHFTSGRLSHDRARHERYIDQLRTCPELAIGGPTWGWLDSAFIAVALAMQVKDVTIPVLTLGAGEERIVDQAQVRRLCERLPDCRCVEFPGAAHELLQETDALQAPVWDEIDRFLARLAPA